MLVATLMITATKMHLQYNYEDANADCDDEGDNEDPANSEDEVKGKGAGASAARVKARPKPRRRWLRFRRCRYTNRQTIVYSLDGILLRETGGIHTPLHCQCRALAAGENPNSRYN